MHSIPNTIPSSFYWIEMGVSIECWRHAHINLGYNILYRILRYLSIQQIAVWYPVFEVIVCTSVSGICVRIGI